MDLGRQQLAVSDTGVRTCDPYRVKCFSYLKEGHLTLTGNSHMKPYNRMQIPKV
jgi:hypothetical protein